jgi:hypothetical protein
VKVTAEVYREVRARLAGLGHGGDWEWAQNVKAPETAEALAAEYTWVVINSGMKNTVARKIMDRVWPALQAGVALGASATELHGGKIFGHRGKAAAIERGWRDRAYWLASFHDAERDGTAAVLAWCESLPWIGGITKYHLAKNLGVDCAKPDRWLVRLAFAGDEDVDQLCGRLARETGDRVAAVDVVLWRACAIGLLRIDGGTRIRIAEDVWQP